MTETLRSALQRLGLDEFHDVLAANDIDAAAIAELSDADLRELGLSIGQRKRFQRAQARLAEAAPPPPVSRADHAAPERRQLTTLFCDLVGSTRLATQLDPEDLHEVLESVETLCTTVLRAHGGHVAYSQGDGFMVYFGFPTAREDDPERAVRAGLDLLEQLRDLRTASREPLAMRIGIATGIVVVGEKSDPTVGGGHVVGETPNMAARLQETAGPGEIVIAETTRRLCGGAFDYAPRGYVPLKGFPDPVAVHTVLGESAVGDRFEARAGSGLNPLLGRDAELEHLLRHWQAAATGAGQVVLLEGDAGIGKSRLAHALTDLAAAEDARILGWQCASHLANRPLHPVVRELEAAAGLGRGRPMEERQAGLAALIATTPRLGPDDALLIADLLGIGTPGALELDAATRARRTHDALARRVEGMAEQGPLLLLLEDAHWADAATLDFLTLLMERIGRLRIMLLITHRRDFVPPWSAEAGISRLLLDPLGQEAGRHLVKAVAAEQELPAALVRTILEKAGGVPLFVEELTRALLDAMLDVGDAAIQPGSPTIPATLHDSLMARLDRLGPVKELAQIGSVLGREFTPAMLRAVLPDHADIEDELRRLCASGLAYRTDGEDGAATIVFHHALVQDAAYDSLLRRRRRELHRAVAEAMLAGHPAFAGAEPEVVARHCTGGELPSEAVAYWLKAGLHALDRAANGSAVAHLRAALDQLRHLAEDETRDRTELNIHMALAPASMAIFGWASREVETAARRAVALAQSVQDAGALFGATWGLWTNHFLRGEMDPALEVARSLDAMAQASSADLLRVPADHAVGFTLYFRGELEAALERAEAGIARFDIANERQIVRMFQFSSTTALHGFSAAALWMMGRTAEAERALQRSLTLPEELGHAPSLAFSLAFTQYTLMYRRDWPRVRETAQRLIALSEEEGFRLWIPQARTFLGFCDAVEGRAGAASDAIAAFEAYAATGTVLTLSQLVPRLGEVLMAAGDGPQAIARLDAMIESATRRREEAYLSELHRVRAVALQARGDLRAARDAADAACDLARVQGAVTLLRAADDTRGTIAAALEQSRMLTSADAAPRRGEA